MNPRNRQFALAGTLTGWVRAERWSRRQRVALSASFAGWNPLTYSRYGHRQWAAPWPWTRVVVKDPFAMLSMPAVQQVTGATPVLVYRHPAAVLTSYRRMGWGPDLDELRPIVDAFLRSHGETPGVSPLPPDGELDEVDSMLWFWNVLYGIALHDAERMDDCVVLAHADVAGGDRSVADRLFERLDLSWSTQVDVLLRNEGSGRSSDPTALHNLDRAPTQVAHEWEAHVSRVERERIEAATSSVLTLLDRRALGRAAEPGPSGPVA